MKCVSCGKILTKSEIDSSKDSDYYICDECIMKENLERWKE